MEATIKNNSGKTIHLTKADMILYDRINKKILGVLTEEFDKQLAPNEQINVTFKEALNISEFPTNDDHMEYLLITEYE